MTSRRLDITERRAFGLVADLTQAGYVLKEKDGRRNRYRIEDHLPLIGGVGQERTIGEVLELLVDTAAAGSTQPLRDPRAQARECAAG